MSFYPVDMPLPDVPNVLRLRVLGSIEGVPWNNIWYARYTGGPPSNAEVTDACAGLYDSYIAGGSFRDFWYNHTSIEAVEGIDLSSSSGAVGISSVTTVGLATTQRPPADTSLLVKLFIARRYRGGHPRKYTPPLGGAYLVSQDQWDLGTITGIATAFGGALETNLFTTFGSITVTGLVSVSFYEGFTNYVKPSGRAAVRSNVRIAPIIDTVSGFETEQQIATQRRRVGR